MYRVAIDESQAEPFATPAETEEAHLGLIERMRAAEAMAGAAIAAESDAGNEGPAATLATLRDEIALFEARLVATGARLPDTSNRRALAQSMLDFWALRQSDLSALAMRLAPPEQQATMRPEPPTSKLLAPYDPATATDAATRAEQCFAGLPDEATREAAKRGFLTLLQTDWALGGAETAALEPFVEARVLSRQPADQPGLGGGLQHFGPIARRQLVAEQNKRGHGDQQTSREGTMALERQAKRGIRVIIRHGGWIAQKPCEREAARARDLFLPRRRVVQDGGRLGQGVTFQ
jgi:hypothetical protein